MDIEEQKEASRGGNGLGQNEKQEQGLTSRHGFLPVERRVLPGIYSIPV